MFSVHTRPEEFENGGFTLKTHQMFSVHTRPEEFENGGFTLKTRQTQQLITGRSFWICVWGKIGQGNHMVIVTPSVSKSSESVFKIFSVHPKTKSRRFHIPLVYRAFSKSSVFKTFPYTRTWKAGVFKFLRYEKSVFEKLRFPDGFVWTVRQTVERKLRFHISPA